VQSEVAAPTPGFSAGMRISQTAVSDIGRRSSVLWFSFPPRPRPEKPPMLCALTLTYRPRMQAAVRRRSISSLNTSG
jgi:hypothetical protein